MNKKIKTDAVDSLFDAVLCLQSREECYSFFEDLCTVNELLSLSQRFEVAAMLKDGKTYLEIAEKTGASTAYACFNKDSLCTCCASSESARGRLPSSIYTRSPFKIYNH